MALGDFCLTGEQAEKHMEEVGKQQDEAKKKYKEQKSNPTAKLFRWWMRATQDGDEEKYLTFIDEDGMTPYGYEMPYVFYEHQLFLYGHWRNWFTCLEPIANIRNGEFKVCPMCLAGHKAAWSSAYTVIDHSLRVDSKGKEHKDELKLFVCKYTVHRILRKASKKKGGLRGWRVEVSRPTSDSPNTGDHFDFEDRIELPDTIVAPNYNEVFARKPIEAIRTILNGGTMPRDQGSQGSQGSDAQVPADDDDIPF